MMKSIVINAYKIFCYIFISCLCATPFLVTLLFLNAIPELYFFAFAYFFLISFIVLIVLGIIVIEAEY